VQQIVYVSASLSERTVVSERQPVELMTFEHTKTLLARSCTLQVCDGKNPVSYPHAAQPALSVPSVELSAATIQRDGTSMGRCYRFVLRHALRTRRALLRCARLDRSPRAGRASSRSSAIVRHEVAPTTSRSRERRRRAA